MRLSLPGLARAALFAALLIGAASAVSLARQVGAQGTAQGTATLTGTVRDSGGRGIRDAEIILRESGNDLRSVRANADGEFTVAGVQPGAYSVWFRRLGYVSVDYNWAARYNEKTDVKVKLFVIAQKLNPVEVRASEDKMMKGNSSLLGLVIDQNDEPIGEAEVQLVGSDRAGTTRANGGFLFKPIPFGAYVVRIRKLGYSPSLVSVSIDKVDDRELVVVLRKLSTTLSTVRITEESGFGHDQFVYQDLEQRLRWHNYKSQVLGPAELKRFEGMPIGLISQQLGVGFWAATTARRMQNRRPGGQSTMSVGGEEDGCVLLNGKTQSNVPLSFYNEKDIDFLEIYPPGTELTGSISSRMHGKCAAISLFRHPTYYVLWEKGRKQ